MPAPSPHGVLDAEREHYDAAWSYDPAAEQPLTRTAGPNPRAALQWLGNIEGKRVLDVGCGPGDASLWLAQQGAHVTALDISPQAVEITRQRAERWNIRLADTVCASLSSLPFADGSFDAVYGEMVLHHICHHPTIGAQAMNEVHRVLRPGGRAVFSENNGDNPLWRWMRDHMRSFGGRRVGDEHELPLRDADLRATCTRFSRVEVAYPEVCLARIPTTWLPWLRRLNALSTGVDFAMSGPAWLGRAGYIKLVQLER